jgi:hypothetical protein
VSSLHFRGVDLTEPTSDANRLQRIEVLHALADVAVDSPHVQLVLYFLQEDDWQLNYRTLEILKNRADLLQTLFSELLELLLRWPRGWKRAQVCGLFSQARIRPFEVLETLNNLANKDESTAEAIWNLTGNIDAIKPILEELLKSPSEETCDLIYKIGPSASFAAPPLAGALASDDADLRWAIVSALGALGEGAKSAIPHLIQCLNDGSGLVAGCAAYALAKIGRCSLPALVEALRSNNSRTREFAADALGSMGEAAKDAVPNLEALLNDSNRDVVHWASIAVGEITRSPRFVPHLKATVRDCALDSVRHRAQIAIEKIQQQGA